MRIFSEEGRISIILAIFGSVVTTVSIQMSHSALQNKQTVQARDILYQRLERANLSAITRLQAWLDKKRIKPGEANIPHEGMLVKIPQLEISTEQFLADIEEQVGRPRFDDYVTIKAIGSPNSGNGRLTIEAFSPRIKGLSVKTNAVISMPFSDGASGQRLEEVFNIQPVDLNRPVDYLIVFDTSSSMKRILERVSYSLEKVLQENPFPLDSRMAVLHTLAATKTPRSREPDPRINGINRYKLRFDPGFLRLVSQTSVERYIEVFPQARGSYREELCSSWFHPMEKIQDSFCMTRALQANFSPIGIEAGMKAFSQLMRLQDGPLFRKHAVVNVIFISDTHEPGRKVDWAYTGYSSIRSIVYSNSPSISGIKFHGLVPWEERCTGENLYGESYQNWISPSGGTKHDICDFNYQDFFRNMADNSVSMSSRRIQLNYLPQSIIEVKVNGKALAEIPDTVDGGWEARDLIGKLDPQKKYSIQVVYKSSGRKSFEERR
ncbi:hypothetical protein [Pseudobacteriovorax antillogorgiicola]|uniref:Uncharacterized protein n=1 Tax=Pseudobacteriovorax antillogorgiicola TaxID=1513793 RepID=A0A1Y6C4C0_9BACT|nr:hypothetical protein [Pseudobacteriovorax antillogorgiicola]TCS50748.1 hypothetical protein EDD56_112131 [Pseudobacteriovorax antillogorgiicola]SMF41062.1 hypothetical protein SAMN06296036_112130 [Pseudobacteriovorax antillogorgiicola]